MPNRDGTGPEGKGPMTGRRLGRCNTGNTNTDNTFRRGQGRGLGRGFGRRATE